jgi:hypothetical protein
MGIPKSRAVKFLTLWIRSQKSHVENANLIMSFTGRKQQHAGMLLLKLADSIHAFCNVKTKWFDTVEETETI